MRTGNLSDRLSGHAARSKDPQKCQLLLNQLQETGEWTALDMGF